MFRLDKKTCLVTGGGSGIGRSICLTFAAQGARVAVVDRDEKAGEAVAAEVKAAGGQAMAAACDIAEDASVEAAFAQVEKAWGKVDTLVNNAGIADVGRLDNTDSERLRRVLEVNLVGQARCARRAIGGMIELGGGVILNLCSIAALVGLKDRFAYSISKGGVLAMTKSIAADYMDKKVRCNCICPARIHTPFVDGFLKRDYPGKEEEMFKQFSQYQPVGRMGRPDEVAAMALYLCSDESAFVTGHAFPLDGGVLAV